MGCLESPRYCRSTALPAVDHHNERRCPQNRERPLLERGRAQRSKNQDGKRGRQKASVIEPGSNPVHTRSSGAIRKEDQPNNTRSTGARTETCVMSSTYTAPIVHADIKALAAERLHDADGGAA